MLFLPNGFYLKRFFRLEVNKTHQKISSSRVKLSPIHPEHPSFADTVDRSIAGTLPDHMACKRPTKARGVLHHLTDHLPSFQPRAPGPSPYFSLKESAHPCVSLLSLPPPTGSSQQCPLFQTANSMCWLFQPLSAKMPSTTAHFLLQLHHQAIHCVCGLWKQRG